MFIDFFFLLIFIVISFFLSIVLLLLPLLILSYKLDNQKISTYECGFVPFSDARVQFEIKFYFIGVSFVLFDIEFSFLFPWIINFDQLDFLSFYFMHIFLILLIMGYIFEWVNNVFEW